MSGARRGRTIAAGLVALGLVLLVAFIARRPGRPTTRPSAPSTPTNHSTPAGSPIRLSGGRVGASSSADDPFSLEARVISTATGAGVAAAVVSFAGEGVISEARSDANGGVRWSATAPGRYQVASITARGYLPFSPELGHSPLVFNVRLGVHVDGVTLFLTPAVDYTGVVQAPDGHVVVGAKVRRLSPLVGEPDQLTSDDHGEVHFHAADGDAFEASHPDYRATVARLDLPAQVSHRLVIRLGDKAAGDEPVGGIAGRVVDEQDRPIAGALVRAFGNGEERALSDDEGRFSFVGLRGGRKNLRATHPQWIDAELTDVPVGGRDVVLRMATGGRVVGNVRERGSGKPITAFTIVAATRRGAVERGERRSGSYFDVEGGYALVGLRPGTQCLSAYALGRAGSDERCVEVTARGETRVDFELTAGARIAGRVTDRVAHTPIASARVSLENPLGGSDSPLPVIASTETDADGRFQLAGTDTGVRSIFIAATGHHSRVIPGLQLEADRDAPSIEIDLQPTEPGEEPSIESAGINVVVSAVGDTLVIGKVTPGGGADQAGLKPDDVILRVDGVDLASLGMQAGIEHLRGPEGSTVTLTVRRPPDAAAFDVVVTRRRVVNR
jgi:hypothetical protein